MQALALSPGTRPVSLSSHWAPSEQQQERAPGPTSASCLQESRFGAQLSSSLSRVFCLRRLSPAGPKLALDRS